MAQTIVLKPDLTITRSGSVSRGSSLRSEVADGRALVTIRGKGITVDVKNALIRSGKDVWRARESLVGTGLLIVDSENVVVKNAAVHGFRFNIRVLNSKNVRIEGCDVGYSRAIRMMRDGRPIDTFLALRDSEAWREYGAGIWIEKSTGCRIERSKGAGGTIGAALVDSDGCTVHDNDFSFCGGWGVALARSNRNVVSWNMLDFDNRVWAGGWGGDSAATAVADDSDENYFVGNSMTHGGDGFFLSNRNDVGPVVNGVFTPKNGSDHNIVAYNDGSWSPANPFEGTFSVGNVYYRNKANDSGYGFWLGFSDESVLIENEILRNANDGIAIEHGRGTQIVGNRLIGNQRSAIHLWANPAPERKPFPSTQIDIRDNVIEDSPWAYRLEGSTDVSVHGDKVARARIPSVEWAKRPPTDAKARFESSPAYRRMQEILRARPKGFRFYRDMDVPLGLEWVQPDEYGPRDFRNQLVAYRLADPGTLVIRPIDRKAKIEFPGSVNVEKKEGAFFVTLKAGEGAVGEEATVEIPIRSSDGKSRVLVRTPLRSATWDVRWYSWKGLTYEDGAAWQRLFASEPLRTERTRVLHGDWTGKSPAPGVPVDHFALVATTRIRLSAGRYTFNTISDDGIRLYVDGKLVIDRWNHHGPTPDSATVELSEGVHEIRVDYCQESGGSTLRFDWRKG